MSLSNLFVSNNYNIKLNNAYQITNTPTTVTTSIAAADIAKHIVVINSTGNVNCQLPTAAALLAVCPNVSVGDAVYVLLVSNGGTATLTTNTGLTLTGTPTIATGQSRWLAIVFTNVTSLSAACNVY